NTGAPLGPPRRMNGSGYQIVLSPDGKTLTGMSRDYSRATSKPVVEQWALPGPVGHNSERLRLWVEVSTGLGLGKAGQVRDLDASPRAVRRQRLQELGGPLP